MRKSIPWAGAVIIITVIFATVYVVAQQSLRLTANDPQIQVAEDDAASLDGGSKPSFDGTPVDISQSLSTFIIVYDLKGKVVAGTGELDGKIPAIPLGALQHAQGKDYNFVTWQPQKGVRLAAVTVSAKNYYVLAARSMREVEKREDVVLKLAILGWAISLIVLGTTYLGRGK